MARLFGTPRAAENGILSAQEVRKLDGKKLKSSLRLHADYMPNTTHDPYTACYAFLKRAVPPELRRFVVETTPQKRRYA